MKSFREIIKEDVFNPKDEYFIDTKLFKMCWGCEKKYKAGHMVWDASKLRRIFLCEDCFLNLTK
ncbi:MAG: hypothetical protein ACFE9S_17360 [Candidatus Hermodarchaeota archaeon]